MIANSHTTAYLFYEFIVQTLSFTSHSILCLLKRMLATTKTITLTMIWTPKTESDTTFQTVCTSCFRSWTRRPFYWTLVNHKYTFIYYSFDIAKFNVEYVQFCTKIKLIWHGSTLLDKTIMISILFECFNTLWTAWNISTKKSYFNIKLCKFVEDVFIYGIV